MNDPSPLEAVFFATLEKGSPQERAAYLDEACAGDPDLRRRAEKMLAAQAQAGSFLEQPALSPVVTADEQPVRESPGTVIGAYKLLEQIGEGGFGIVFMAEQQEPIRRKVALKVLKPGMDTRQVIARFEAERQALALMDHANIAKVLEGGQTTSDRPYFVMDLVKGLPITEYCDQSQLTPRERLELFVHVCQAVQHAHQKGIIHRDIKPTNVLVTTQDGAPQVKVIDFGIAKALGQQLTDKTLFTGFAQMIGTPLYMSPEQAALSNVDVDTRSDIYSLGVLLYELLTGTTPFDKERFKEAGYDEIRRIIREEEPPRPSTRISTMGQAATTFSTQRKSDPKRLSQLFRGELDWIVMKCLEKDRNRRYETANGLAHDIERYLHDEPVQACPPSTWYRFYKFASRNRAALTAAAILVATLLLGIFLSAWQAIRATQAEELAEARLKDETQAHQDAEAARQQEGKARKGLESTLYINRVALAHREWQNNNIALAQDLLEQCPADVRDWEWYFCKRLCHMDLFTFGEHQAKLSGVAFAPDGKHIASASADGTVYLWDIGRAQIGFRIHLPIAKNREVHGNSVAFSPDGQSLALGCSDSTVRIVRTSDGHELKSLRGPRIMNCVAFSPNGNYLAASGWKDPITVWKTKSNYEEHVRLEGHAESVITVAFSPDSKQLASTSQDKTVRLWNLNSAQEIRKFEGHDGVAYSVAFSPDGQRIVSGGWDGTVRLWEVATGRQLLVMRRHSGFVRSVAFSPDGARVASSGEDNGIKLWHALDGAELFTLRGHKALVSNIAFSPDGTRIASASNDGTVKLWDTTRSPEQTFRGHDGWVRGLAFSPDGKTVVSATAWPTSGITAWNVADGSRAYGLRAHAGYVNSVAFAPDGKAIATASNDRTVRIWHAANGQAIRTLNGHDNWVNSVAYSPDGKRIASASYDHTVRLWNTSTYEQVLILKAHTGYVYNALFSPDGRRIASGSVDGTLKLWESASGAELMTLPCKVPTGGVNNDEWSRTWNNSLAFSPDSKQLAAAGMEIGDDGRASFAVKIWDVETGQPIVTLRGHAHLVNCVAFSQNGRRIATGSLDGTIKLWDVASGAEVATLRGHNSGVLCLAFSPNGRQLVSGSIDFTVRLWDATPMARSEGVTPAPPRIAGEATPVPHVAELVRMARRQALGKQWADSAAAYVQALERLSRVGTWTTPRKDACRELAEWEPVFDRVVRQLPEDPDVWIGRGRHLALIGESRAAEAAYAKVIHSQPVNDERFEYACLLLMLADHDRYKAFCQELLDRLPKNTDPYTAYVAARTFGLSAQNLVSASRLVAWGEQAVKSDANAWHLHTLALSHYRAKEFERAIECAQRSNEKPWYQEAKAQNGLVLALSHHRLGHADEARASRGEALKGIEAASRGKITVGVPDWFEMQVLVREAQATINATPAKGK